MSEIRFVDTLELVRVTVSEDSTDISGDDVQLAFLAPGEPPTETDWIDADWEAGGPPYVAKLIVGKDAAALDGAELAVGEYMVWVRVTDSPEIPVRAVFRLIMLAAAF